MLQIKNPHSVLAAILARPKDVSEVYVPAGMANRPSKADRIDAENMVEDLDAWSRVVEAARANQVRVGAAKPLEDRGRRNANLDGTRTALAYAMIREKPPTPLERLFDASGARSTEGDDREDEEDDVEVELPKLEKGLWLALDQIQDPHNVGAIFRAASFFGVRGIIFPQDRSASLTSVVYDVACGGVEDVPYTAIGNLKHAMDHAKERGLWVLGTSEHATQPLKSVGADRAWLLVLGNEENGIRRLTQDNCDVMVQIPPKLAIKGKRPPGGGVTSLNVSVAGGILMSHLS